VLSATGRSEILRGRKVSVLLLIRAGRELAGSNLPLIPVASGLVCVGTAFEDGSKDAYTIVV